MGRITLRSLPKSSRAYAYCNVALLLAYTTRLGHKELYGNLFSFAITYFKNHIITKIYFKNVFVFTYVINFQTWLHSYSKLFLEACKRCGKFVSNGLPPTWRDLRTLEPFHEECRNC